MPNTSANSAAIRYASPILLRPVPCNDAQVEKLLVERYSQLSIVRVDSRMTVAKLAKKSPDSQPTAAPLMAEPALRRQWDVP